MTTHIVPANTISAITDPIDTAAVQRGLNTKALITELQSITEGEIQGEVTPHISNINVYLDQLDGVAPSARYWASQSILNSLGWNVVNQLLWQHRKSVQRATADVGDSVFGDDEMSKYPVAARSLEEVGFEPSLDQLDALALIGVYKRMLWQQTNSVFAAKNPPQSPNAVLGGMLQNEREEAKAKAYATAARTEIAACAASAAIKHAMVARYEQSAVVTDKTKAEIDYVIHAIRFQAQEDLTDEIWANIPIWVQYKYAVGVFKQIVKAIAYEWQIKPEGSYACQELMRMAGELKLELDCAARTKQVKLAFATGRLDERHEIEQTDPIPTPTIQ